MYPNLVVLKRECKTLKRECIERHHDDNGELHLSVNFI